MSDRPAIKSHRTGALAAAVGLGSLAFGGTVGVARSDLSEGVSVVAIIGVIALTIGMLRYFSANYVGDDQQQAHSRMIAHLEARIEELEDLAEVLQAQRLEDQRAHEHQIALDQRRYIVKLAFVWSHVSDEARLLPGFPTLRELINGDWEPNIPGLGSS